MHKPTYEPHAGGKGYRLQGKKFFFTYPRCSLDKHDALVQLQARAPLAKALVAHETHANGESHLHAYVCTIDKLHTRDPHFWDLYGPEDKMYHGNYQTMRAPLGVFLYIQKEDKEPATFACDPKEEISARTQHRTVLGKRFMSGEPLHQVVAEEGNEHMVFGYKKL